MKPAILFLEEVTSTMDVAKQCLALRASPDAASVVSFLTSEQLAVLRPAVSAQTPFAICAARQTAGRGTAGRAWQSPVGNLFCTVCLPLASGMSQTVSHGTVAPSLLPVLPLLCGVAAHHALLTTCAALRTPGVSCKWPNDILVQHKKTGGILIEGADDVMLVGVGINLTNAPTVADGGRPSTCVADVCAGADVPAASVVAEALVTSLIALLDQYGVEGNLDDAARRQRVIASFNEIMDREVSVFRRLPNGQRSEEPLKPLGMNEWGLLRVVNEAGKEEALAADYLY